MQKEYVHQVNIKLEEDDAKKLKRLKEVHAINISRAFKRFIDTMLKKLEGEE